MNLDDDEAALELAAAFLAATEAVGKEMCREVGVPVDEDDTFTLDTVEPHEREGLIRVGRRLLDQGWTRGPVAS